MEIYYIKGNNPEDTFSFVNCFYDIEDVFLSIKNVLSSYQIIELMMSSIFYDGAYSAEIIVVRINTKSKEIYFDERIIRKFNLEKELEDSFIGYKSFNSFEEIECAR